MMDGTSMFVMNRELTAPSTVREKTPSKKLPPEVTLSRHVKVKTPRPAPGLATA
jgi:hypothetical protein